MDIKFSISPAPGIATDWLVAALYEETAPTTLVQSQGFAAPHTASQNISFTGLNPVPHIVIIYQNAANVAAGTIRHRFIYDPNFIDAEIRSDMVLTADTTPGFISTGLSYTDATLKDWSFDIERRGFGTMEPGVDYSWDNTLTKWTLLDTVDTPQPAIQPGEKFILHFLPRITIATNTGNTVAGLFSSSFDIAGDVTLTAANMGQCGMIAGAGDHLTVTLPSLSAVADNKILGFISEGGSHINAQIKAAGTDAFNFMLGAPSVINMGQAEALWLFKKNGKWNVAWATGNFKTVGDIVEQYSKDPAVVLNTVFASGSLLSRTTYARLWKYVQSLDPSEVVNDTDWNNVALNNKGRYSTGDGATTFRIPLLYLDGFMRAVDGVSRKAGSHEELMFPDHRHEETIGLLPASPFGQGTTVRANGRYGGSANTKGDLTGSPVKTDGSAFNPAPGAENRPANTGIYKLIRI
jgi:hypothetical protein